MTLVDVVRGFELFFFWVISSTPEFDLLGNIGGDLLTTGNNNNDNHNHNNNNRSESEVISP